jgi:hypothetical protein
MERNFDMDRIETLRKALTLAESHYSKALDRRDYDTANFISKSIDGLQVILATELMAEDPYASEADVRHFEGL